MRIINGEREREKKKYGIRQSDAPTRTNIVPSGMRRKKKKGEGKTSSMASSYSAALNEKFALSGQIFTVLESTRNETIFSALMIRLYVARFQRNID